MSTVNRFLFLDFDQAQVFKLVSVLCTQKNINFCFPLFFSGDLHAGCDALCSRDWKFLDIDLIDIKFFLIFPMEKFLGSYRSIVRFLFLLFFWLL